MTARLALLKPLEDNLGETLVIMITLRIAAYSLLFYFQPHVEFAVSGNSSGVVPQLSVNTTRLEGYDPSTILSTGGGALAAIFAIVFGLSQLLTQSSSDRYGPRMAE